VASQGALMSVPAGPN